MQLFDRIIKCLLYPLLFSVAVVLLTPLFLSLSGYRVNADSGKVAILAAEKKDVSLCKSILNYGLLVPQTGESRAHCVYRYAKITKDPSACELLMPSEYGWSCVGAATDKEPCLFDFKEPPEVRGNGIIVPMSQCLDGNAIVRNNTCCGIARIAFLGEKEDCSSLVATRDFVDQCHHEVALKRKESAFCDAIQNDNIKSACLVQVSALNAR